MDTIFLPHQEIKQELQVKPEEHTGQVLLKYLQLTKLEQG
jgi:hypothetical protein